MSMIRTHWMLVVLAVVGCGGEDPKNESSAQTDRIFVADEESGTVSILEEGTNALLQTVKLPTSPDMFMPHNVQAAPDGKSVWVAAAPMTEGGAEMAFVIAPESGEIVSSIELGAELHVAHVVLDPESKRAFVSANEASAVLEIDAEKHELVRTIDLGTERGPHGMRWCRDRLWIANMTAKTLASLDPATAEVSEIDVGGVAVQTACTPDANFVFVSLYDTKEVVRYDMDSGEVVRIALPPDAQGPVQLYPSPDSKTLWVCDQGILLERPASNRLYAIDIGAAKLAGAVVVGAGAHGVVLSDDGAFAYVTNIADDTVSVVDTAKMTSIATVPVGIKPNGVSHWHRDGAMP